LTKVKGSTAHSICGYQNVGNYALVFIGAVADIFHSGWLSQVDSGAFKSILLSLYLLCVVTDRLYSFSLVNSRIFNFSLTLCAHILHLLLLASVNPDNL
jgi:hypothetical protein